MGEQSYHLARPRLAQHGVQVLSSSYGRYGEMSRRVVQVLSGFTAGVEVYSIDEAFLDFSGMNLLAPDLLAYGAEVRARVREQTGIPTCVGIAPTKTLAKLANRLARKQGTSGVVLLNTPARWHGALAEASVESIWGVGRRYARKLLDMNVTSGAALAALPEAHHSVTCTRSFGRPQHEPAALASKKTGYYLLPHFHGLAHYRTRPLHPQQI